MKAKLIFFIVVVLLIGGDIFWIEKFHPFTPSTTDASGRKVLYYTCAMHPWVREHKPGPCPVCGMNMTPIYENAEGTAATTNSNSGEVTLDYESISVINVQTAIATNRPVTRTLHLAGQIVGNSAQAAWFEFTAYQRDFKWLKTGQTLHVSVEGVPNKIFTAQIKLHGTKPFVETDFDMMSSSTTVRAEISDSPVKLGELGKERLFNNLHAEAHLASETESVLTIPRTAIISRGLGATVYVDKGNNHYAQRDVLLGRIGDEFAEVVDGLKEGEHVVTTGNILIDSEAQLVNER